MAAKAKYDWEALLKEYLQSDCKSKTQFAESKGINASLLRRNTADWPSKSKSKSNSNKKPKRKVTTTRKVTHKSKSNKETNKAITALMVAEKTESELNDNQRMFCFYFSKCRNATLSYFKAYGCSYASAGANGPRLMGIASVRKEINRLLELKRQAIMLDPDDIVERYMCIAFSDATDIAGWGTEEYPAVDENGNIMIDGNGNVKMRKRNYLEFKDSSEVDGGLVCEVSLGRSGLKVKMEDRQKALKWLADYFNMNPMNRHKVAYDKAVLSLRERELKTKEEGW